MAKDSVLERLWDIVEGQDGYFSMPQAKALGIDRRAVIKACNRGRLERISRGVYRFTRYPITSDRVHLWEGVLWPQAHEPVEAVLSHETALALHGLSDANPETIHILVSSSVRIRRDVPAWLTVHRRDFQTTDTTHVDGLPVTTPDRTLHDIALDKDEATLAAAIQDAKRAGLVISPGTSHTNG